MEPAALFENLVVLVIFVGWMFVVVKWISEGMKIPSWLHYIAIVVGTASLVASIGLLVFTQVIFWQLLLLPSPMVYLIWTWLNGPEFQGAGGKNENGRSRRMKNLSQDI